MVRTICPHLPAANQHEAVCRLHAATFTSLELDAVKDAHACVCSVQVNFLEYKYYLMSSNVFLVSFSAVWIRYNIFYAAITQSKLDMKKAKGLRLFIIGLKVTGKEIKAGIIMTWLKINDT